MTVKAKMTKEQLRRSHDAMARVLIELCKKVDGRPYSDPQTRYRRAIQLIREAGFKYESKR